MSLYIVLDVKMVGPIHLKRFLLGSGAEKISKDMPRSFFGIKLQRHVVTLFFLIQKNDGLEQRHFSSKN